MCQLETNSSSMSLFRREFISKHSTLSAKYPLVYAILHLWASRHPAVVLATDRDQDFGSAPVPGQVLTYVRKQYDCTARLTLEYYL